MRQAVIKLIHPTTSPRRKTVWGFRPTSLALAGLLAVFGAAPLAAAAGAKQAPKTVRSGAPNSNVRQYRVDPEVARKAKLKPNGTTRVIVTLQPGASVPAEFRKYARGGKLKF